MGSLRSVSIGTTMAFAQLWLMPRLGGFWTAHQDIVIDHIISDRTQDLHRPDVDLRVRYGDGSWPDEEAALLFGDRIVAVASPGFIASHKVKSVKDLAALPLLSVEGVDWTWTTWAEFPARDWGSRTASSMSAASTAMSLRFRRPRLARAWRWAGSAWSSR